MSNARLAAAAGLALAMAPVTSGGPPRRSWSPKNYESETKRKRAKKANKAARKSRRRNRQ